MTFGLSNLKLLGDHSLSDRAYGDAHSYYSDSELVTYFQGRSLSLLRPAPSASTILQDLHHDCERNLGWNIDWAVAFIVDYLDKKKDAAAALRNIRIRATALEKGGLAKDIPDHIFNKLDETLFAGHLRNAVYLDCSSIDSDVSGATYTHSWGPLTEVKRISIILNSNVLDSARARDVIAILIHHMIHAYFLVACGPQKEDEVEYGRLSHGHHFGKVMTAIRQLSGAHGKELTALNFGHDLSDGYYADGYWNFWRRPLKDSDSQREKWYCSHCHSNVYEISASELDKWYTKTIRPMLDQPYKSIRSASVQIYNDRRHEVETKSRARLPPSSQTVELIYQDKPTLIDAKHLDNMHNIKRTFAQTKSRFLKSDHKEISERTFLRFLEYIHTGAYRPDPFALSASSHKRPPIIKAHSGKCEAWILADVQFAKMGNLTGFDECTSYALGRMNAYDIMIEDPIAVLQEIYKGKEPCRKLKEWVRRFLVARPVSLTERPNLVKLEDEQGPWRARLHDAMENSGALENEVRKAWVELCEKGWLGGSLSSSSAVQLANLAFPSAPNLLALGGLPSFPFQQQQQYQLLLGSGGLGTPSLGYHSPSLPNINTTQLANLLGSAPYNNLANSPLITAASALELEHLKAVERQKIRELEKERKNMQLRESNAQIQFASLVKDIYQKGLGGGYVEDNGDDRY
jgi:hypothetical protein